MMTKNHGELKTDIHNLINKVDSMQDAIQRNEQKIKSVEIKAEQTEKNLEQIDQKIMVANKDLENSLIHLEMDQASFYLRFQNVVEMK